jgi:glycerol-3-phosphate dehydrogenase
MFRAYGTDIEKVLDGARSASDLGKPFGWLSEREVDWLAANEWALTADDILWRRSKLGLHLSQEEQDALRRHLAPRVERDRRRAGG